MGLAIMGKEESTRSSIARAIGNKSEATVSSYMSLARKLPDQEVIEWIGNAREVGRPRWEEFVDLWDDDLSRMQLRKRFRTHPKTTLTCLGRRGVSLICWTSQQTSPSNKAHRNRPSGKLSVRRLDLHLRSPLRRQHRK